MAIKRMLLVLSFMFVNFLSSEEREMVVIIPSYNNEAWYYKNLISVIDQEYDHFSILYINDCSTDRTGEKVEEFAKSLMPGSFRVISFDGSFSTDVNEIAAKFREEVNRETVFFTLVNNTSRCGALENLYRAIYSCPDHEIVVTLDGDDWLLDNLVLKRVDNAYASGEVWMTHGRLIEYPHGAVDWCEPVPPDLVALGKVRQFKCPSHLRTFYAWIFKKIALEDLLYDGKFYPMTWDMAIMYPILEMAGDRHAFLSEINYVYNMINPINDGKVNQGLQQDLDRHIRKMKPYQKLEKCPL